MTTIQGSISNLVMNSSAMFETLGYLSSNAANLNTDGYKAQRFETYLSPDGVLDGKVRADYSKGCIYRTNNELDVGIDGAGFIPVTSKNGTVAYTRNGSFKVNGEGYIVTSDGWLVGSGIKIPANYEKLKIDTDGTVSFLPNNETKFKKLGNITTVTFNNPEGLKVMEGNRVAVTEESGPPTLVPAENRAIKQNMLEKSNVDIFGFVNDALKANGSLIASVRLVKMMDEMYREAINLRQ